LRYAIVGSMIVHGRGVMKHFGSRRRLMAWMLLACSIAMRRVLALAVVLILAGLAPASAIIGFCTRMPCCSHGSDAATAIATERNDCCTTITCFDSPSAKLANGTSSSDVFATPALVAIAAIPAAPVLTREVTGTSPPATARQRLAALSTLLI
jgi:hypothetical protein